MRDQLRKLASFLSFIGRWDYTPEPERMGIRRAWFLAGLCQEVGRDLREHCRRYGVKLHREGNWIVVSKVTGDSDGH